VIIAHRNVRPDSHRKSEFFGKEITPEQKTQVENLATPNILYDSNIELRLGTLCAAR